MNEITKIHLGRQAFNVSVPAHKALRDYLDAIEKQVGDKDVVNEVELRMAELLAERGVSGDKVVLIKDVDYLKGQLGDPKDFKEDEEPVSTADKATNSKRLFRDTDNAMLAGVAAGLSKYFGVDVLLIRILFVIGTIAWGGGILLYLALWLLVPEAKTSSDRLQMAGKPINVSSLKEAVERADVKGAARRANNSIAGPINSFFRVMLKLIGAGFVIAGLSALFGIIAATTYMLLHTGNLVQDNLFPVGFREHLLLDIGLAVAALISVFVILFGMSIYKRRWPIRAWVTGILIGLLFTGLATGGALTADAVPHVRDRYNANVHTVTRFIQPFTTISPNSMLGNGVTVRYEQSSTYSVSLNYYDQPDLSKIETTVSKAALTIDTTQFDWHRHCSALCIPDTYNMAITVYSPNQAQIYWPSGDATVFPGYKALLQQ